MKLPKEFTLRICLYNTVTTAWNLKSQAYFSHILYCIQIMDDIFLKYYADFQNLNVSVMLLKGNCPVSCTLNQNHYTELFKNYPLSFQV